MFITITDHAFERFEERVTSIPRTAAERFIKDDLRLSDLLYSVDGVEKRIFNGIVYVVDIKNQKFPKVVTLYLQ